MQLGHWSNGDASGVRCTHASTPADSVLDAQVIYLALTLVTGVSTS